MLQRKQTIWLLLAAAAAFLTLNYPFYTGNVSVNNLPPVYQELTARFNTFLLILTVAVGLLALVNIFLYKNRKLQLRLTVVALIISLGNIILYVVQTKQFANGDYSIKAILALIIPVVLILAARGIYKDEKLVKSVDRLR